MIVGLGFNGDRLGGVKILRLLGLGLEQFKVQAVLLAGVGHVLQQIGHLGAGRQLAQHHLQVLFHLFDLFAKRFQIGSRPPLFHIFLAQRLLLPGHLVQLLQLIVREKIIAGAQNGGDDQHHQHRLARQRPLTRLAQIEIAQVDLGQIHIVLPPRLGLAVPCTSPEFQGNRQIKHPGLHVVNTAGFDHL